MTIETPRLFLRLPVPADAQALLEIHTDPQVLADGLVTLTIDGCATSTAPPQGLDVAFRNIERMHRHWREYGYGQWSVVEKKTGAVIGCVGFYHVEQASEIEIGWIIRRSHWGNGVATEAARAAIDWVWRTTNIDHVISLIRPTDARSMKVAEKAGQRFEREGVEPISGENRNIFGIYRSTSSDD
jgi:RimJ/RimL family protein N-acetyltransferase